MEPQIQRWTAKRKAEVILDLIKGNKNLIDVCREHDLKQSEVENWINTVLESGEKALKVHSKDSACYLHDKLQRSLNIPFRIDHIWKAI